VKVVITLLRSFATAFQAVDDDNMINQIRALAPIAYNLLFAMAFRPWIKNNDEQNWL